MNATLNASLVRLQVLAFYDPATCPSENVNSSVWLQTEVFIEHKKNV